MRRTALLVWIVPVCLALMAVLGLQSAPAQTGITITVDRSVQVGTSRLALGVTHTNWTVLSGDSRAVATGRSLLPKAVDYQNQFVYGWGTLNPEPSPGVFDWTTL